MIGCPAGGLRPSARTRAASRSSTTTRPRRSAPGLPGRRRATRGRTVSFDASAAAKRPGTAASTQPGDEATTTAPAMNRADQPRVGRAIRGRRQAAGERPRVQAASQSTSTRERDPERRHQERHEVVALDRRRSRSPARRSRRQRTTATVRAISPSVAEQTEHEPERRPAARAAHIGHERCPRVARRSPRRAAGCGTCPGTAGRARGTGSVPSVCGIA